MSSTPKANYIFPWILFQGGMVSHPRKKSTNPFDMTFEADVDANDMVFLPGLQQY